MTHTSIVIPGWSEGLAGTFFGPAGPCIFRRSAIVQFEDFRFIFGCSTIGADPRNMRGSNGDD